MSDEGADDRDPLEGLEERLKSHAAAFESLLALTPAREYYGSQIVDGRDPSEQWNRKKQTREEKRAAKKAKLDPANQRSALDVIREKEREAKAKRKRNDVDEIDGEDEDAEPGASKRQKSEEDADAAEARRREKAQKKKEKRQRKKEKSGEKKAKAEAKKARKQDKYLTEAQAEKRHEVDEQQQHDASDDEAEPVEHPADLEDLSISGLDDLIQEQDDDPINDAASAHSSAPTTPLIDSPAFDMGTNHSTASSSSSLDPPSTIDPPSQPTEERQPPPQTPPALDTTQTPSNREKLSSMTSGTSSPKIVLPHINTEDLQARLRTRIEALRAARKADGPEGKPAKSRQELLDQRRKKEEQRKATKKAQRQKLKEEEQRKREEQLRGSGSPLSILSGGDPFSPAARDNKYAFSRLAFEDGTAADANLTSLKEPGKKRGPQDPRTALQAAQNRDAKFSTFSADKQKEVGEKNQWLNARKRAQGERVRDDTSLLKKALKRKEKQKGKSESAWKDREQAVIKGKEMRQKKREGNLAKRREEKGGGGGKKKGGKKMKKKGRPGFEGRFKA